MQKFSVFCKRRGDYYYSEKKPKSPKARKKEVIYDFIFIAFWQLNLLYKK
jgi:hypothetical protein